MKSFLVVGLGRFGRHLAISLMSIEGNEVMVLDNDEQLVTEIASNVTNAQIGDCTKESVLKSIGVKNFDVCFVCIGSNFQSSLETAALLKELGAKCVISKVSTTIQAKFLLRNGADEVIYPEKETAEKLAIRYSDQRVKDFISLSEDTSIFEIECPEICVGKNLRELDVRNRHNVNVLTIKTAAGYDIPSPDYRFKKDDNIMILGKNDDLIKLFKKLKKY